MDGALALAAKAEMCRLAHSTQRPCGAWLAGRIACIRTRCAGIALALGHLRGAQARLSAINTHAAMEAKATAIMLFSQQRYMQI